MSHISLGDIPMSELAHHGVKGMKWGVRRTPEQLGNKKPKKPKKKKITNHDIKSARVRQTERKMKVALATMNLNSATAAGSGVSDKGQKAAAKAYSKALSEYRNNPDFMTSRRFTTMEKVGVGVASNVLMPGIGTIPALAIIGINSKHTRSGS